MELFWARGYEGATLDDLQAAMGGISPPSFYHAFGSKEALFKEVAELYIASVCGPPVRAMEEARTAREGIEAMLRRPSNPLLNLVNPEAASSTPSPSALPPIKGRRRTCRRRASMRPKPSPAGLGAPLRRVTFRRTQTYVASLYSA